MTDEFKIVFVIGAGAGVDIEMPTGAILSRTIRSLLPFDLSTDGELRFTGEEHLKRSLELLEGNLDERQGDEWIKAAEHISRNISLSRSIDNFVDSHKTNPITVQIAKLAIVAAIQAHEASCTMRPNKQSHRPFDPWPIARSWLTSLWQALTTNCDFEGFRHRLTRVSFINFNYDRCLEYLLLSSAQSFYRLNEAELKQVERGMRIIHPYGSVGELSDLSQFGRQASQEIHAAQVARIHTFTEGVVDPTLKSGIQHYLKSGNLIVFLGFAFHSINMELMFDGRSLCEENPPSRTILATSLGLSDRDSEAVKASLEKSFNSTNVELANMSCRELFDKYQRTMFDRL